MPAGTDIFADVRASVLRKLEANASAMTAAELELDACKRRQDELMAQLCQLPAPALPHLENVR